MSEQEAIAYIEEWDVTEAAKVLKWYEEHELLRPCDCDTIVAVETEYLQVENAKLREQMERLVTLLRVDCDIDASWDGLRRFWSIGLTEDGCLMRDRACKAEAENAKLRELMGHKDMTGGKAIRELGYEPVEENS